MKKVKKEKDELGQWVIYVEECEKFVYEQVLFLITLYHLLPNSQNRVHIISFLVYQGVHIQIFHTLGQKKTIVLKDQVKIHQRLR